MKSNFPRSIKGLLVSEGGWSDHPKDPGGATMKGVIQTEYDSYRVAKGRSKQSVRFITDDEVLDIYRSRYADKIRFDDLPMGVDYATLDGAVNSGVSRGAKWLQSAVGVSADGAIGNQTVAAAAKADSIKTVKAMCAKRMSFLRGLTIFSTFGKGWTSRVSRVEAESVSMAMEARGISSKSLAIAMTVEAGSASKKSKTAGTAATGSAATSATSSTQIDTSNLAGLESILLIGAAVGLVVLTVYLIHRYRVQQARSEAYATVAATATEAAGAAA
jgi:lysozyme family protein